MLNGVLMNKYIQRVLKENSLFDEPEFFIKSGEACIYIDRHVELPPKNQIGDIVQISCMAAIKLLIERVLFNRTTASMAWLLSVIKFAKNNPLHVSLIFAVMIWPLAGCSSAPKLTAKDRENDIKFFEQWARDYSPFVELNERLRGLPNYEQIAPQYIRLASEAKSDVEFYQAVYGYFSLLGVSGHGHLLSEESLKGFRYEGLSRPGQISREQLRAGYYWPRLEKKFCFVHPPFRLLYDGTNYAIGQDWKYEGVLIPKGSIITHVNGKPCADYIEWLRQKTWVRHIVRDTDWIARLLLAVHEGPEFQGWQVVFQRPDSSKCDAFVPYLEGPQGATDFTDYGSKDGNCVCLELTEEVGYIRVKCMGGMFIEKDRKKIRAFFEKSGHKYRKLIIDIRQNGGGLHYYAFDNLIAPFLDRSVSYSEIGGIRKPFLTNYTPAFLEMVRGGVSIFAHERNIKEIQPPEGYDPAKWVFYQIDRRVDPKERYQFNGQQFILIDGGTGSAADEYANAAQRIGLATLVGKRTPGSCSPYFNPIMVRLPASGMIFLLEADLMLNKDGTVNEIVGTRPDTEMPLGILPDKVTREELLRDAWITKIISR